MLILPACSKRRRACCSVLLEELRIVVDKFLPTVMLITVAFCGPFQEDLRRGHLEISPVVYHAIDKGVRLPRL